MGHKNYTATHKCRLVLHPFHITFAPLWPHFQTSYCMELDLFSNGGGGVLEVPKIGSSRRNTKRAWHILQWKRLSVDLPPAFPSCTVLLHDSPFVMKDTDTHAYITNIHDLPVSLIAMAVRVFTHRQTDTQKDGTDSITSTADAGGKYIEDY